MDNCCDPWYLVLEAWCYHSYFGGQGSRGVWVDRCSEALQTARSWPMRGQGGGGSQPIAASDWSEDPGWGQCPVFTQPLVLSASLTRTQPLILRPEARHRADNWAQWQADKSDKSDISDISDIWWPGDKMMISQFWSLCRAGCPALDVDKVSYKCQYLGLADSRRTRVVCQYLCWADPGSTRVGCWMSICRTRVGCQYLIGMSFSFEVTLRRVQTLQHQSEPI